MKIARPIAVLFQRKSIYPAHSGLCVVSCAAILGLAGGCDRPREEQHDLEMVGTPTKVPQSRAAEPHDRFLRTHLELATDSELSARAAVEEVKVGVRIEVNIDDAKPGKYTVVVHDGAGCEESALGKPFVFSPEAAAKDPALGEVTVEPDGQGEARWLTTRGNLQEKDPNSLLGKPLALYASYDRTQQRGEMLACELIHRE